jgi:hypothetical protein
MEGLPACWRISADIQMEGVSAFINPVPQLKSYPPPPSVGKETRTLNDGSFLNEAIIVSNAGHKNPAVSELCANLHCRFNEVLVARKMRERVVDT